MKLALIGFPYDENSSYLKGPAFAPPLIREAFHSPSSGLWSELGVQIDDSILMDKGDVRIQSNSDMFEKVENALNPILSDEIYPIALGGDHFITYPIIKTLCKKFPSLHILHLDAHPDLYDEFEGNRFSHACPFARILEDRLIGRLTQIGIRCSNQHLREQAKKFNVQMIDMGKSQHGIRFASELPIYLSIDMDVLDPAFAPGISHREPGGFSTRQVIELIHQIKGKIVGADIVECNPKQDPSGITVLAAAKLLKEVAAKMFISIKT